MPFVLPALRLPALRLPALGLAATLLATLFTVPAAAQVRVTSGDHSSFTRLVFTFPTLPDWRLGRTEDGYLLRLEGGRQTFDLSQAFQRITRSRLSSIWVDPSDGTVRLGVACSCHAIPFEYRQGILVVDLRDGPPPSGSSFELTLDGQALPPLEGEARPRPRPRAIASMPMFDWRDQALGRRWSASPPGPALPVLPTPDPTIQSMRRDLLTGFAQAAAAGLIDPALSTVPVPAEGRSGRGQAQPNMRLGDRLDAAPTELPGMALAADGRSCPDPRDVDVGAWGDDRPVPEQMAAAMNGLLGEFDRPDPARLEQAVRLHLHLGFGAEASGLLRAFPQGGVRRPDLLASLARIIDGHPDPDGPLRGMAACDGAAALWAFLADPSLPPSLANPSAIIRSFSDLPAGLRRHLGPPLAERFLFSGDLATATAIQDALQRLPGDMAARNIVTQSRLDAALGAPLLAEQRLQDVIADPGPDHVEALVALVDLRLRDGQPLDPAAEIAISAHLAEFSGTPDEPRLRRAHVLALALTDQFDAAFAALPAAPQAAPDLWRLLARGPDSAILGHALAAPPPGLPPALRAEIGARLRSLGFPDQAQRWSGQSGPVLGPAPPPDPALRQILARNWPGLGPEVGAEWRDLAARLAPVDGGSDAPLAQGRTLAEASAATRAAIADLLAATEIILEAPAP